MTDPTPIEKHDQDLAEHVRHQSAFKAHLAGIASALGIAIACIAVTWFSHFAFGIFKVAFGVFTGVMVKSFGKGSGTRYGILAGGYAVLAAVLYESLLGLLFYDPQDPSLRPGRFDEELEAFRRSSYELSKLGWELASAAMAFLIAFRIGRNPMRKDELDYLLEAKYQDSGDPKYAPNHFRKRARR